MEILSFQDLYCFGSAECDQYDTQNEDKFIMKKPIKISFFVDNKIHIAKLVCGGMHSLALSSQGQLYSWGCNDEGALGRKCGENEQGVVMGDPKTPTLVELEIAVDLIAAGDNHSIAGNSVQGKVYLWGSYRTTSSGSFASKKELPERIGEDEFKKNKKIDKILSGSNHTLVLTDQKVFVWGDPETGVLGRKPTEKRKFSQALRVEALGYKNVVDIYTGVNHSFLKCEKTYQNQVKISVFAWGLNNWGQLGLGYRQEDPNYGQELLEFKNKNVLNIVGGEHHSVALVQENGVNNVYAFGKNDDGQCGLGEDYQFQVNDQISQEQKEGEDEQIQQQRQRAIQNNAKFVGHPVKLESIKNASQIFSGTNYSYVKTNQNHIFSWGMSDNYVLGNGKDDDGNEYLPYKISDKFFEEKQVGLLALGGYHVAFTLQNQNFEIKQDILKPLENQTSGKSSKGSKKSAQKNIKKRTDLTDLQNELDQMKKGPQPVIKSQ